MNRQQLLIPAAGMVVVASLLFGTGTAPAQVAGSATIGVTAEEMKLVALGWSAKKNIMGKPV